MTVNTVKFALAGCMAVGRLYWVGKNEKYSPFERQLLPGYEENNIDILVNMFK